VITTLHAVSRLSVSLAKSVDMNPSAMLAAATAAMSFSRSVLPFLRFSRTLFFDFSERRTRFYCFIGQQQRELTQFE
jgi:hypothetical protein